MEHFFGTKARQQLLCRLLLELLPCRAVYIITANPCLLAVTAVMNLLVQTDSHKPKMFHRMEESISADGYANVFHVPSEDWKHSSEARCLTKLEVVRILYEQRLKHDLGSQYGNLEVMMNA